MILKALLAIRDILVLAKEFVLHLGKVEDKKKVDKAIKESDEQNSQRPIEEELSGDSGNPTKYVYVGMREREKEDKSD